MEQTVDEAGAERADGAAWAAGVWPEPLDPQNPPALDQYCDLVMKGGVVDGVVYPGAMMALARHYRFKNIGGTSVGAIAGALLAAAEYSRRHGSDDGFNEVIRKIPDELAGPPDHGPERTRLRSLFQPDAGLERLFLAVVDVVSRLGQQRWLGTVWAALRKHYRTEARAGLLWGGLWGLGGICIALVLAHSIGAGLGYAVGMRHFAPSDFLPGLAETVVAGALGAAIGALVGSVYLVARALYREYVKLATSEGFGFCSGMSEDGGTTQALIDWLHRGIQGAAGLPLTQPLTFGDLWAAPGGPHGAEGRQVPKSIDLRMMATAVSHGRPYELPMTDPAARLFFDLREWKRYFPASVISHLRATAPKYLPGEPLIGLRRADGTRYPDLQNDPQDDPLPDRPDDFRELPVGDLPVLVAARMSMNFPVLFQALPMWAIDHEAGVANKEPSGRSQNAQANRALFNKVWFSDGGITANFPIHFFDCALPRWPTFGLLFARTREGVTDSPRFKRPCVARFHTQGRAERWLDIGRDKKPDGTFSDPVGAFRDYLVSVFYSAFDWQERASVRMPGTRDRIASIYLDSLTGGGLNLNLDGAAIRDLGYRVGCQAGEALAEKFLVRAPPHESGLQGSRGWLDHRWVRLNTFVSALRAQLNGFRAAAHAAPHTASVSAQIERAETCPPLNFSKYEEPLLSKTQADALREAVRAIEKLEKSLTDARVAQPYTPKPAPELKSSPRV